jgi:hypothetical protein
VPRALLLEGRYFDVAGQNSGGTSSTRVFLRVLDLAPADLTYYNPDSMETANALERLFSVPTLVRGALHVPLTLNAPSLLPLTPSVDDAKGVF